MATGPKAVILGVGEAALSPRGSGRSADTMTVEAALNACADAGISPHEVDGVVKYTYDTSINSFALTATLGSRDQNLAVEVPFGGGSCAALIDVARSAVEAGRARAVLCFRTVAGDEWVKTLVTADPQRPYYMDTAWYLRPVGWTGYLGIFAAFYSEYVNRYPAMSREALYAAVNLMRSNAALNSRAVFTEQVSREDYFSAPLTVGPFTRYDEFALADNSSAVLVGSADLISGADAKPIDILASAQSHGPDARAYFDSRVLTSNLDSPASWVARKLFEQSGLTTEQVDVGLVYDCTSFTLLLVAEQFGLSGPGEVAERLIAGDFGPTGSMPLNPHGGETAAGYTHGFRHIVEAVKQLRGVADNQVRDPEIALVGGPQAGPTSGLILSRR